MRKAWLAALLVLVAVGVGGWAALAFLVDAKGQVRLVASALTSATGWSATADTASLSLRGGLALDVRGVALRDPRTGSTLVAERALVEASLGALRGGDISEATVRLLRPRITFARDAEGGFARFDLVAGTEGDAPPDEVRLEGARIEVAPRHDGEAPLVLDEVSAVYAPGTGRLWGTGRLSGTDGSVTWLGEKGGDVELSLTDVPLTALAALVDLPAPAAGSASGKVTLRPGGTLDAAVMARGLRLDASAEPLPDADCRVRVAAPLSGAHAFSFWSAIGKMRLQGEGQAREGALALSIETDAAPIAAFAAFAKPALEWPFAVDGAAEGTLRALVRAELARGATPAGAYFDASARMPVLRGIPLVGDVTGAEISLGADPGAPPQGRVTGNARGGALDAALTLDRALAPQAMTLDGAWRGVALGGGALADLSGRAMLGRDGSASDVALAVTLRGLPGASWDLLAPLGCVRVDECGPYNAHPLSGTARLEASAAGPWRVRDVRLENGELDARGAGTFDPRTGAIALTLDVAWKGGDRRAGQVLVAGTLAAPRVQSAQPPEPVRAPPADDAP